MNRKNIVYNGNEIISETLREVSWEEVRDDIEVALHRSDWRFMADQSPSQEWIDYRQFLRDLPQNHESANDAADAWNEYEKPEGA